MENEHFFGEWIEFYNEEEQKEAEQYLALWEKFFVRKVPELEHVDSQVIIRRDGFGLGRSTIGVKIMMRGEKPDNVLDLSDYLGSISNGK